MVILFITFIHIICCLNILTSSGASRLERKGLSRKGSFWYYFSA